VSHDCFGREPCGERYCRRCNTFKQDDDDDDDDTPTPEEHMPTTPAPRLGDTVLWVSHSTLISCMNWTADAATAWSDDQIDGILDAAWEALDVSGLDIGSLYIQITGDVAPRSAWIVGGDDGENDAALLRRWDAAVDAAAGGAA